jgi:hypothetical protein
MNIICSLQGHTAFDPGVWNEGFCFSSCTRCSCDMIRTSDLWSPVPAGYQVIWRSGRSSHALPSGFKRNLPLVVNRRYSSNLGWKLGLHRRGVGCIMLPADRSSPDAQPGQETALAALVVTILSLVIQAVVTSTARLPIEDRAHVLFAAR